MSEFLSAVKENGFILPDYKNSNLSVLKDIVNEKGDRAGEKEKKVFLVIDAMGHNLMKNLLRDSKSNSLLNDSRMEKISTIFPSTTVAVLSSFETGMTPAEHGMVGWDVYSKELGMVVTPYRDSPTASGEFRFSKAGIESIRPDPQLFMQAAEKGRIMIFHEESIGTISKKPLQNCDYVQYSVPQDMSLKLRKAIKEDKHDFIYVYYSMIDHLEHLYGQSSEEVRNGLSSLFSEMNRIMLPALKESDYNLVMTADHGQIDTTKFVKITGKSKIMEYSVGPSWGDARVRFMNVIPGKEEALARHFEKEYGKDFLLFDSESVIRSGVFGKESASDGMRYRFGTHIMLAKGGNTVTYEYPNVVPKSLVGMPGSHSGLSKGEMEVPLIVY